METKWLEDFVSLAETRSFSRSAQLRHVTQPAFSRRIQALEAWAGTDLVDRSSYPTSLTPAGKTMYEQALEMLQSLQSTRSMLRSHAHARNDMVGFAVPHTLALTFFPHWVAQVQERFGPFKSRLMALNVHDAAMRLSEGGCDLLLAYCHSAFPLPLDPGRYDMVSLGQELMAPYCRPDAQGQPLYPLPGSASHSLPFLAYGPSAYLGRVTELILKESGLPVHLKRVYETDMAEGLKAMALQGLGVAFLPLSAVSHELSQGRLVRAGDARFEMPMDVRAYRERPVEKPSEKSPDDGPTAHTQRSTARALWDFLRTQATQQCLC